MPENLREFRHAVSVLKKQGLIVGKKIDARSAYPSWKVNGKRLDTLIRKYDDIVSGKASTVSVPPEKLKQFRKAGYETSQGRVIVPHSATDKAVLKHGEVTIVSRSGIQRVQIPVEYHNLPQYLKDIERAAPKIDAQKAPGEYFGFRFYGNNSAGYYSSVDLLVKDFAAYKTVEGARSRYKQKEVYKNLEIFKLPAGVEWTTPSERKRKANRAKDNQRLKRARAAIKRNPAKYERFKRTLAARAKAFRAGLKQDVKAWNKYLDKSRKRAAASRAEMKKAQLELEKSMTKQKGQIVKLSAKAEKVRVKQLAKAEAQLAKVQAKIQKLKAK